MKGNCNLLFKFNNSVIREGTSYFPVCCIKCHSSMAALSAHLNTLLYCTTVSVFTFAEVSLLGERNYVCLRVEPAMGLLVN